MCHPTTFICIKLCKCHTTIFYLYFNNIKQFLVVSNCFGWYQTTFWFYQTTTICGTQLFLFVSNHIDDIQPYLFIHQQFRSHIPVIRQANKIYRFIDHKRLFNRKKDCHLEKNETLDQTKS